MLPRPAWRNTRNPASVVASMRRNATAQSEDRGDQNKGSDFRERKQQDGNDDPLYHDRLSRPVPAAGEVGAAAGIVYGRFEATRRPCRPKRLFIAAVAFLHYSVGTGMAGRELAPRLTRRDRLGRPPPREQTCSTSTPSFSWPWRCSFSSACAACSANAPAVNGRPMTPIPPRRAPSGPPPGRQGRGAARPRPRYGAKDG